MTDLSDTELLERAVRGAGEGSDALAPRWVHTMVVFQLVSGVSASQLCKRFSVDPKEIVGLSREEKEHD